MSTKEGAFNVAPINNDDSPKHGILLHFACWQMLMARLNGIDAAEVVAKEKELPETNLHAYHFLKTRVDDLGCAARFDYGASEDLAFHSSIKRLTLERPGHRTELRPGL